MAGGIVGSIVGQLVGQAVSQTLGSLLSQFGQGNILGALSNLFMNTFGDVLNNIINNSPLPQFIKYAANEVIDDVIGSSQQQTTPEAQCAVEQSDVGQTLIDLATQLGRDLGKEADESSKEGGNWLIALAKALGNVQGEFIEKAMANLDTMENKGKESKEFIKAQNEFTANMQMFSMMANTTSTALKAIGEGMTAIARKQ